MFRSGEAAETSLDPWHSSFMGGFTFPVNLKKLRLKLKLKWTLTWRLSFVHSSKGLLKNWTADLEGQQEYKKYDLFGVSAELYFVFVLIFILFLNGFVGSGAPTLGH